MAIHRFICSSPDWHLSGVNTFTTALFETLREKKNHVGIVLTEVNSEQPTLSLPRSIPVERFPSTTWGAIRRRQQMLISHLLNQNSCIYLPNYDFNHLPVVEVLPPRVKVILTAHSDEEVYYTAIAKYGGAANAIVAVSKTIEVNLRNLYPEWNGKIIRIPYGVPIPERLAKEPRSGTEPLHVVYSGRLSQSQKRIYDLAEVILACHFQKLPIRFSIAGMGADEIELRRRLEPCLNEGNATILGMLSVERMNALFVEADVVILTSEYEGLPLILLEAMARGCVPVVSRIASGIGEVIREDDTGKTVAVGDIEGFVAALLALALDRTQLSRMSQHAADTIRSGPFNINQTANSYLELARASSKDDHNIIRRGGQPNIPAHYKFTYRIRNRIKFSHLLPSLSSNKIFPI